jgi:nitric oxide reductase subunit C
MIKRTILLVIAIVLLSAPLAACGGSSAGGAGDAERGKQLYNQVTIGPNAAPGCVTCHSIEPGKVLVGPSHAGIATRAETEVPGQSAEEFLKESITNPNAHVTEGFASGVMYQNYAKDLTDQEINDLVAYLMTLK